MNFIGKIRDPLHNTIPYTKEEKTIIDSREFQRLRRVHQTAFIHFVFPGATHTRFEHSLGTMHTAGLLYSALVANQRRILSSLEQTLNGMTEEHKKEFFQIEDNEGSLLQTREGLEFLEKSTYLEQCLRFAALLHDCGHSPLSHSGERFMPTWQLLGDNLTKLNLPDWLNDVLKIKISTATNMNSNINHEIYTLLIVYQIFKTHFCSNTLFLSEQMARDICSVLNTNIVPHPEGDLAKSGMQFLFNEVVSGEIDVDRMDYLTRDSYKCGVVYGHFDLGRILDSLGFYLNTATHQYHLALRRSGISAYEDYLRARLSMYNQVYFHKTATACEAMLEHIKTKLPRVHFPINIESYINLDDYNIFQYFKDFLDNKNTFLLDLLRELLFERKLWKRIYEESIPSQFIQNHESKCPLLLKYLNELDIPVELINTSTNLTRFLPKSRVGVCKNKLKVIVKNFNSVRYLDPIENHSNLINRVDEEFVVKRIFISNYKANGDKIEILEIQKLISKII